MRTEGDLRAALRALREDAPKPESVAGTIYEGISRRHHIPRHRVFKAWLTATAIGATAAAVALTTVAGQHDRRPAAQPMELLSFTRHGDEIDVLIRDPLADPARYRAEFAQHHMDITLSFVPVAPSLVGTLVTSYSGSGITAITAANCKSGAGKCPPVGLRIPVSFHGPATIEFGRAARPGEQYVQAGPATAPGEPLHGIRYVCQEVPAVVAMLRQRHTSAVVRYPTASGGRLLLGSQEPPGTWYVNEATMFAANQVMLWAGSPCTPGLPGSAPGLPGAANPTPTSTGPSSPPRTS